MGIISSIKKLFERDGLDPLTQIEIELLKRSLEHHDVEPPLSSIDKLWMEIQLELLRRYLQGQDIEEVLRRNRDP
jgi:hypothetical protein